MSLIAHYPLNGNARDYFGNNGTPTDITWVTGKLGQAADFNGTSSLVDMGDVHNIGLGDISWSVWVKSSGLKEYIFSKARAAGQSHRYGLYIDDSGFVNFLVAWGRTAHTNYPTTKLVNDDIWHHILVSIKRGNVLKIWVDGVLEKSFDVSRERVINFVSNNPFRIGAYTTSNNSGVTLAFLGIIDDLRIYNHAVSEKEVSNIYLTSSGSPSQSSLSVDNIGNMHARSIEEIFLSKFTVNSTGITVGEINEVDEFGYPLSKAFIKSHAAYAREFIEKALWSVLFLFANGEQGAWYDPSDLSTLFQDSAGTIPVTADGDPIGLMLDKSGNGNHASQSVSAKRMVYGTDGFLHWIASQGLNEFLTGFMTDFGLSDNAYHFVGYRTSYAAASNQSQPFFISYGDAGVNFWFSGRSGYFSKDTLNICSNFPNNQVRIGASINNYTRAENEPDILSLCTKTTGLSARTRAGVLNFDLSANRGSASDDWAPSRMIVANNKFYIGSLGLYSYAPVKIHSMIVVGRDVNGDELENVQSYVDSHSGVTL